MVKQALAGQLLDHSTDSRLEIDDLANRMLATYSLDCGVNSAGEFGIPSDSEVERMTLNLLSILFPGYREEISPEEGDIREYVAKKLSLFSSELRGIVKRAVGEKK